MPIKKKANNNYEWSPARPNSIECIQIVYKVAERCNINCSYCYYFNMGDETALDRPVKASIEITEQLGAWLAQGCKELLIDKINISFHGGEPMLIKPSRFDKMCRILRQSVFGIANITFSIQTNGTLFNKHWLNVFRENEVHVGVSIDGSRETHDRYRLDKRGSSTFDKTESTIKKLVEAAQGDRSLLPSTISVLDNQVDYQEQYKYLRRLGIKSMGYLLPDRNADDLVFRASGAAIEYGNKLVEIFDSWFVENNPDIQIRFIDKTLRHFQINNSSDLTKRSRKDVQILIVQSDGSVTVDDSYIPALEWYSSSPKHSVSTSTLQEILEDPIFISIEGIESSIPSDCQTCQWQHICRGGDLENRYSVSTGFNNRSIYCDSFKIFYSEVCEILVQNGYPRNELKQRFSELTNV